MKGVRSTRPGERGGRRTDRGRSAGAAAWVPAATPGGRYPRARTPSAPSFRFRDRKRKWPQVVQFRSGSGAVAARTVRACGRGRTWMRAPGRWSPVPGGGHLSPPLSLPVQFRAGGARPRRRTVQPEQLPPWPLCPSKARAAVCGRLLLPGRGAAPRLGVSARAGDCRVPRAPGCPRIGGGSRGGPQPRGADGRCAPLRPLGAPPCGTRCRPLVTVVQVFMSPEMLQTCQSKTGNKSSCRIVYAGGCKGETESRVEAPARGRRVARSGFLRRCP